jgi:hypothetical protein
MCMQVSGPHVHGANNYHDQRHPQKLSMRIIDKIIKKIIKTREFYTVTYIKF